MNELFFFTAGVLCSLLCILLFFLALGGAIFRRGVRLHDVVDFFSGTESSEPCGTLDKVSDSIAESGIDESVSSSETEERIPYERLMELYQDTMQSHEHQTILFQREREENKRLVEERERYMREIESLQSAMENQENLHSDARLSSILRRIFNLTDRLDEITGKLYSVESSEIADGSRLNTPNTEVPEERGEAMSSDSPVSDPVEEKSLDSEVAETVPASESDAQAFDSTSITAYEIRKLDRLLNKPVMSHYDNKQAADIFSLISESELLETMLHCRNTYGVPVYEKIENMKRDFESVLNSRNTSPEMKDEAAMSVAMISGLVYSGIPGKV